MDNFIVSARKYRPVTFKSVVGQASITTTLKNSISKNHLAHAYLFFGPRGVGKTTCARIFAKTINCENITSDFEACNECESCKSFNESRSFNIHELDAASNNSVDDMRNLTDQVRVPPQIGKYSIYIIDEVHMLSASAFNAFLKTLEEPPPHAIFILATTEKHKIIPTILSRCQIFDFNRIEVNDIVNHLEYVSKEEGVNADRNGLNVIAQKADGAMRDALSIFDQIVSFSGNEITYKNVLENLNVLDYEYFFKLVDAFHKSDYATALVLFNEILNKGFDGQNFITGLSKHLRDILVCQDLVTVKLLEVGADIREKYKEQASRCEPGFLLQALDITNKFDLSYKNSNNKRLHIEIALLQLSSIIKKKTNYVTPPKVVEEIEDKKSEQVKPVEKTVEVKSQQKIESETVNTEKNKVEEVKPEITEPVIDKKEEDKPVQKPEPESIPAHIEEIKKNTVEKKIIVEKKGNSNKEVDDADYIPSINDAINGTPLRKKNSVIEDPQVEYSDKTSRKISEEELKVVWKELTDYYRKEEPRLATILENNFPKLTGNNVLYFKLLNTSQENNLNEVRKFAIPFLREKLSTNYITFKIEIEETIETDAKPYTQEEKIKYMSEKYPDFGKFKERLKLDYN